MGCGDECLECMLQDMEMGAWSTEWSIWRTGCWRMGGVGFRMERLGHGVGVEKLGMGNWGLRFGDWGLHTRPSV